MAGFLQLALNGYFSVEAAGRYEQMVGPILETISPDKLFLNHVEIHSTGSVYTILPVPDEPPSELTLVGGITHFIAFLRPESGTAAVIRMSLHYCDGTTVTARDMDVTDSRPALIIMWGMCGAANGTTATRLDYIKLEIVNTGDVVGFAMMARDL